MKPKFPKKSLILMLIYLIGGSVLIAIPNLPRVFGGIDLSVLIVGYIGYFYIIGASIFYALKGE